jgi:hypothetical protein
MTDSNLEPRHAIARDALIALRTANAAARRGERATALELYRALVARYPDCAPAHANLRFVLNDDRQFAAAEPHFRRALALTPDAVPPWLGLAHALRQRGQAAAAEACYQRVLALEPTAADAYCGLGLGLLAASRLAAARGCFAQAIRAQPDCVEAYHLYSTLARAAPDDPLLAACEALQPRVASMPAMRQARYWFALGKLREDAARFDAAFAAYAAGNRARASLFRLDESGEAQRVAEVCGVFTTRLLSAAQPEPGDDARLPVFVVGVPRSGTTLVEQMLASCAGVRGVGEVDDLQVVLHEQLGAPEPWRAFAALSPSRLPAIGQRYLDRLWRRAPGARCIVNKMPANFRFVGIIRMLLPQARIIHVVRQPMASCFSCYARLFAGDSMPYSYDLEALGRYYRNYAQIVRHWRAVAPGAMLDVRYEDLVSDTERQARRMLAYAGLPWDARCLEFHRNTRVVETASRAQVRRPIYRDAVDRWRHFERHLAPLAKLVADCDV